MLSNALMIDQNQNGDILESHVGDMCSVSLIAQRNNDTVHTQ